MASSPGRVSGLQSAVNTGGQVIVAVNTPTASTSIGPGAPTTKSQDHQSDVPDLFDPTHIPTIFLRIQTISRLLIEASNSAHSLLIPQEQQQQKQQQQQQANGNGSHNEENVSSTSNYISSGPDFAMGAMDEDDVNSGFEAILGSSLENDGEHQEKAKRTELAHTIVKESRGLRDAFDRARVAINSLDGGEMDIDEQERLISMLQDYREEQR